MYESEKSHCAGGEFDATSELKMRLRRISALSLVTLTLSSPVVSALHAVQPLCSYSSSQPDISSMAIEI